ncbi:MAG: exodeoxyribonuclease VII small subunit [Christensenellales bacterium]
MAKKEMTFEQAKEKLDGIVEKLSDGNLPIEEMVKLYEEGAGFPGIASACLPSTRDASKR